jgi:hypothetical protein
MPGIVVARSAGQGGLRRQSAATHLSREQRRRRSAEHRRGRQDRRQADKCRGKPHVTGFHTVCKTFGKPEARSKQGLLRDTGLTGTISMQFPEWGLYSIA